MNCYICHEKKIHAEKILMCDDNCKIYICNKCFYELEFRKNKSNEDKQIDKIKNKPYLLQFVHNQTHKICLAAFKQHGNALQYVISQTPEICLVAVRKNKYALEYVKEQTPEICLAAVRQYGCALKYVEK